MEDDSIGKEATALIIFYVIMSLLITILVLIFNT